MSEKSVIHNPTRILNVCISRLMCRRPGTLRSLRAWRLRSERLSLQKARCRVASLPEEGVVLKSVAGLLPRLPRLLRGLCAPRLPHAGQQAVCLLARRGYSPHIRAQRLEMRPPHRRRPSPLIIQRRILHNLVLRGEVKLSVPGSTEPDGSTA